MKVKEIDIENFDYPLPPDRIARYPLDCRDHSKLLVYDKGEIKESLFYELKDFLPENSLLVFNNTKVIHARMLFAKDNGTPIEIFCLQPYMPADYAQSLGQTGQCIWLCLVKNSKKWKSGKLYCNTGDISCTAERIENKGETSLVRFSWDNNSTTFADILEGAGQIPIPPYLNRPAEKSDCETYQTVYSKINGSVAAPTAGLHFTDNVFASFAEKHITTQEITLHVGAGTFKPVKSATLGGHEMHTEYFSIDKSVINNLINYQGKVIAVGTTSARTLESLYYIGLALKKNPDLSPDQLFVSQWDPYEIAGQPVTPAQSLLYIKEYLEQNGLEKLSAATQILIAPGYRFGIVNGLITNFHQPKSTLLLLISAFTNGHWRNIYDYALKHDFRFLSYGDSSLIYL